MTIQPGGFLGAAISGQQGLGVTAAGVGRPIPLTSLPGLSMQAGADTSAFDPRSGLPTRPARTFAEAAQFSFQQNRFVNQLAQRARAQAEATIQQALGLVQRGGPGSLAVLTSPLFTQLANIRGQATFQPFDFTAGLQQPTPFLGGGGAFGVRNLAAERRRQPAFSQPSPIQQFQQPAFQFQQAPQVPQFQFGAQDIFAQQQAEAFPAFPEPSEFFRDPNEAFSAFQPFGGGPALQEPTGEFAPFPEPSEFFREPIGTSAQEPAAIGSGTPAGLPPELGPSEFFTGSF